MENHHFQWENPLFLWSFSTMLGTLGGFLMAGGTPIFQKLDGLCHFMGKKHDYLGYPHFKTPPLVYVLGVRRFDWPKWCVVCNWAHQALQVRCNNDSTGQLRAFFWWQVPLEHHLVVLATISFQPIEGQLPDSKQRQFMGITRRYSGAMWRPQPAGTILHFRLMLPPRFKVTAGFEEDPYMWCINMSSSKQ